MHPEDRVLVGVMTRKKDFTIAREQCWYRIPQGKVPRGIHAEYIAFFFSRAFGKQNGAIHYYARRTGLELATRAELLPDEASHKRASQVYHKLQFRELKARVPPIVNKSKRRFAFIHTTWDRFIHAETLDDLYSKADHLVDRVYYALAEEGFQPEREWESIFDYPEYPHQAPQVRVLCEDGDVIASTSSDDGLPITEDVSDTIDRIRQEIKRHGGPRMLTLPLDP